MERPSYRVENHSPAGQRRVAVASPDWSSQSSARQGAPRLHFLAQATHFESHTLLLSSVLALLHSVVLWERDDVQPCAGVWHSRECFLSYLFFRQKISYQSVKPGRLFKLCPMTTVSNDV